MDTGLDSAILDPARLDELLRQRLLDTPPEEPLDRLTRLAARLLGVPIALVSLVDGHRQFFKSACGLPEPWSTLRETPLSHSFCKHVVADGKPMVIEDARVHPLVCDNPAVSELAVVSYLGLPLIAPSGQVLGSFCAISPQPRKWTTFDLDTMRELARSVMSEIELRHTIEELRTMSADLVRQAGEREQAMQSLQQGEARLLMAQRLAGVGNFELRDGEATTQWSDEARRIMGLALDETPPRSVQAFVEQLVDVEDRDRVSMALLQATRQHQRHVIEFRTRRRNDHARTVQTAIETGQDEHGRSVAICTARDISARIRSQDMLLRLHREVTVLNESLEQQVLDRTAALQQEIGERKAVERDLRVSEQRFSKLAASAPGVIYSFRLCPDGGVSLPYASAAILDTTGFTPDQLQPDATPFFQRVAAEDLDYFNQTIRDSAAAMSPWQAEFGYRHPTKGAIWLEGHSNPVPDETGGTVWHGFIQDVTPRKQAERRVKLLMDEVNHRAKNLLALVQSIAQQTAESEPPETFVETFNARIAGLAACHDLIVENAWEGVGLAELVRAQLKPLSNQLGTRIRFAGPPVNLKAASAQAIGMALHEMATNAIKYGALSNKAGEIDIAWTIGKTFQIGWRESGGPRVVPPSRHGFGRKVIVDSIKFELDAQVTLDYPPSGLKWTMVAPIKVACHEPRPAAGNRRDPFEIFVGQDLAVVRPSR